MRVSFNQLIGFAKRAAFREALVNGSWTSQLPPFSDVTGFHVYSDLDLILKLSAAEDGKTAYLNLQILQAYASAAEAVSDRSNTFILEVQGQRLHLFQQAETADDGALWQLIGACRVFHSLASAKIREIVPSQVFNIRMALDHGRAILI